jgi:GNAT superfamily N-acetyltransferase
MTLHPVEVRPVDPQSWPDVERVLGRGGSVKGCWCMWFRVGGAERRALWGEGNRRAMREIVDAGRTPGLIAYRDGEPIGWCSVAPRAEFPMLSRSPVSRPVGDAPVWSLVCLYVVPGSRRLGVARQLVRAASAHAADSGAQTVEAYPVDDTMGPVTTDAAYHGVVTMLRSEGFAEVARRAPRRPVMRRDVRGLHSGAWTPAPE